MVLNRAPRKGLGNSYYGFGYSSLRWFATYYGYGKEDDKKSSKKSLTKK